MLTLVDVGSELHKLDDTLHVLEARLEDVSARLDDIARGLAAAQPVPALHADSITLSACGVERVDGTDGANGDEPEPETEPVPPAAATRGPRRVTTALLAAPVVLIGAMFAVCVVPTLLGFRGMVVNGGSMAPAVPLGSLAFTRSEPATEVERGDVIVVDPERKARFLHRVERVRTKDRQVLAQTRGDANPRADPDWVVLDRDVARLAWSVPILGYLLAALATPLGWVGLVLVPAALVCASMLRQIWAVPAPA